MSARHPFRLCHHQRDLHVDPQRGRDKWTGRFPQANTTGNDGPLRSLTRALLHARDGLADGPVTIHLADGVHQLAETLELGPELSDLRLIAAAGARPVLSGGRRLQGFVEAVVDGRRQWTLHLPEVATGSWSFRSLFVDGVRRLRPRLPREGTWRIAAVPGLHFDAFMGPPESRHGRFVVEPGQLRRWRNLGDVEVVAVHYWNEERLPLAEVDEQSGEVRCAAVPVWPLKDDAAARCARYWVENVAEALAEPGEWYLDRASGLLTYLPMDHERLEETAVVAPVLDQLLRIAGNAQRPVRGVHLQGLTLMHGDWSPVPGRGGDNQAASSQPGLVELRFAQRCTIADCTVTAGGGYGIGIERGCRGVTVSGSRFSDLAAGGIAVRGAAPDEPTAEATLGCRIVGNEIAHCGRIFPSAVGILLIHTAHAEVVHNHIQHLEYSGISCGWVWGYGDNPTHHVLIAHNHIHDLGSGLLSDLGGIYTLGEQPGTVLRGNLIHDIRCANYGGWAIYLDEGSSWMVVEGNCCHRTGSECFNLHYGRENQVRDNIFALAGLGVVALSCGEDGQRSFTFERNLVLTAGTPVLTARDGERLERRCFAADLNVYHDRNGQPISGGDERRDDQALVSWERIPFARLQELGYDRHSLLADPGFADPDSGDFSLPPDGPAAALGIRPFARERVGPAGWDRSADPADGRSATEL